MIVEMLRAGMVFGLVTAAGYPGASERYEARLHRLLQVCAALARSLCVLSPREEGSETKSRGVRYTFQCS